jgi:hypothetical protein
MNPKLRVLSGAMFVVLSLTCTLSAQQEESGPEVTYDSYHDTSLPVRQYPSAFPQAVVQPRVHPRPRRMVSGGAVEAVDQAE